MSAEYWATWAASAAAKTCEACNSRYQPAHPRQRYCHGAGCPALPAPRRARPRPRAKHRSPEAAARAAVVHAFLGDVVLQMHAAPIDAGPDEVVAVTKVYLLALQRGATDVARNAAVRMAALTLHGVLRAA